MLGSTHIHLPPPCLLSSLWSKKGTHGGHSAASMQLCMHAPAALLLVQYDGVCRMDGVHSTQNSVPNSAGSAAAGTAAQQATPPHPAMAPVQTNHPPPPLRPAPHQPPPSPALAASTSLPHQARRVRQQLTKSKTQNTRMHDRHPLTCRGFQPLAATAACHPAAGCVQSWDTCSWTWNVPQAASRAQCTRATTLQPQQPCASGAHHSAPKPPSHTCCCTRATWCLLHLQHCGQGHAAALFAVVTASLSLCVRQASRQLLSLLLHAPLPMNTSGVSGNC
jgi:hypothetical protein